MGAEKVRCFPGRPTPPRPAAGLGAPRWALWGREIRGRDFRAPLP